jgi:glyoxylase-like metal-dependent hydrolase (beta-lactamase superfamily II)
MVLGANGSNGKGTAPDIKMVAASLRKLRDYDIRTVICYHGGIADQNTNERIEELAAGEYGI